MSKELIRVTDKNHRFYNLLMRPRFVTIYGVVYGEVLLPDGPQEIRLQRNQVAIKDTQYELLMYRTYYSHLGNIF